MGELLFSVCMQVFHRAVSQSPVCDLPNEWGPVFLCTYVCLSVWKEGGLCDCLRLVVFSERYGGLLHCALQALIVTVCLWVLLRLICVPLTHKEQLFHFSQYYCKCPHHYHVYFTTYNSQGRFSRNSSLDPRK